MVGTEAGSQSNFHSKDTWQSFNLLQHFPLYFSFPTLVPDIICTHLAMKFSLTFLFATATVLAPATAQVASTEFYPDPSGLATLGYKQGDTIPLECIQRNIETGEHKFDEAGNIVYAPFPNCFETDKSLSLRYNVDEVFNCTIDLGHDFFHVFQLLIHEDVPFSCRIPYAKSTVEKGEDGTTKPAFIPLTFNIRGNIQESHLHIDPFLNVAMLSNNTGNTVVSGSAFSSGHKTKRVIIGDSLPLTLAVRWYRGSVIPTANAAFFSSSTTLIYCFATLIGTLCSATAVFYGFILPKKLKFEMRRHIPGTGASNKLD